MGEKNQQFKTIWKQLFKTIWKPFKTTQNRQLFKNHMEKIQKHMLKTIKIL